jgi:hypothetical protein
VRFQEPPISRLSAVISDEMSYSLYLLEQIQHPDLPITSATALCLTVLDSDTEFTFRSHSSGSAM